MLLNQVATIGGTQRFHSTCARKSGRDKKRNLAASIKRRTFDVLDLKDIMRKNWAVFEPHFIRADRKGGKDKVLSFVDKLNELRRLTGHPLKMHVSGYSFCADERAFLEDADSLTLLLATPFVRGKGSGD